MITDNVRVDSYARALRQKINSDSVVLDIGAGPGIFSLLACQFGARRVFAVEPDNSIQLAKDIAVANGFADRIEFIQELSTKISLPEKANVIVSDISGVLSFFKNHVTSIVDARERLLAPDGSLIPSRNRLWATLVSAPEFYEDHMSPWSEGAYGLDLSAGRSLVANTWRKFRTRPEQVLFEPQCWADIDYLSVKSPNATSDLEWCVEHESTAHAIVAWVDATMAEGISFSNAPGNAETIYGNAFFPLLKPLQLNAGDRVSVQISAHLVKDDYVWRWRTKVDDARTGTIKAEFDQSTFYGAPFSPTLLKRGSASYVPELNDDGRVQKFILECIDNNRSLEVIATDLLKQFPSKFPCFADALNAVADASLLYSV